MIDAGRAPETHRGLIVFYDHVDPNLRYVAASVPRIARKPDPLISLLLFRGEGAQGGLLQLEAELAPRDEQVEELSRELARRGPPPRVAQPDWRTGEVEVAGWLAVDELKPVSLALGAPLLVGSPRAVLSARLDQAGAAMAEQALRGNALPTALLWRLETLGLAGPLGVEVEADLQAMHDRLTAEGALTIPYGRARIAKTWEEMTSDNLIRVRVVDESGHVESRRAEAVRRVGEQLTAEMFSPFPPPERPPQLDDEHVAPFELSFRLTMRREELAQTRRWSFAERRAVRIMHYAGANLIDFLRDADADAHITFVDLDRPWTRTITVRTSPGLDRLGLAALEVDLDFDDGGDVDRTVAFSGDDVERRFSVERSLGDRLRYRARSRFDPTRTRMGDRETEWIDAQGDFVFVPAGKLFPSRTMTLLLGAGELDWIDHVEVRLAAPREPERTVLLSREHPLQEISFPGAGAGPIGIKTYWRGAGHEPQRAVEPFETEQEIVTLDSPFGRSIRVLAAPMPLADVLGLTLELRVHDGDFVCERSLSWEAGDRTLREAALRRLPGSPRSYQSRTTKLGFDGALEQGDWIESESATIAVGADEPVKVYRVEFFVLGGGPVARGSLAIELSLEAGDERATTLLEDNADQATLTLTAPMAGPAARARAREFRDSGRIVETTWSELKAVLVIELPPEDS
ncbi:MAG: hypothetical protein R3B74_00480 [Nitrospirales bacterium]|nr:hypothetical protein [Nitrospirales bacterium]